MNIFIILSRLCQKAKKLFEEALNANSENDEEVVYIYLMKYCEIIQIMKSNFKADSNYIILMNREKLKKALFMLTHIKGSLEKR